MNTDTIDVSVGFGQDEEGYKTVIFHIHGMGRVEFGSIQAIAYGNALYNFGKTAAKMNEALEESEE